MPQQSTPVVSAVGLTKTFRDFWGRPKAKAVNDVDFEISEGEVVGLLGPNGSGKSTTVKMILGLLYPTGGTLSVLGRSPRAVETKREIGYLPEESYLYKYLTAEETLDFFGAMFNLSRAERRRRVDQLLDMVGMAHARRRRVGEFSKGMARRIGLAQAMINDPSFLVLDEPTSGLDPLGCKEVKNMILMLKKRGKTVLITSHLLSDIEDVCDRVIILYGGRVRAVGSLQELLTVEDENRIITPALPPEAMNKLVALLREHLRGEKFLIDHPHRTLEEFFLDVINRAKEESVETAGVVGGGEIAEYLSEDGKRGTVLDELMNEQVVAASVAEEAPRDGADAAPDVEEKLTELTDADERGGHEEMTAEEMRTKEKEQMDAVNARLDDLLGGRK